MGAVAACRHLAAVAVIDARPLIQTMQAVEVLPLICWMIRSGCRETMQGVELLPLIRRMIRSGCRHLVAVAVC